MAAIATSAIDGRVGFNILSSGKDRNDAGLLSGGALYSVDLKTGKATMVGKIEGLSGKVLVVRRHDD